MDSRLEAAAQQQVPYADFLADLLGVEAAARQERYLMTRLAHLPYQRTMEQFDFSFQPSIDARHVREVETLSFISKPPTTVPWPPGVGKTHLAVALGLRASEQGSGGYFVRAHDLLEGLRTAQAEHRLGRRMRVYLAPEVLIIDEFGVWPYDRLAATALFTLISARYERGSIILTSHKGFAERGDVLGDSVIAAAILDRLLHHSHVLNIRGDSYRLREKKRAGFFATPPAGQEVDVTDPPDPLNRPGVGHFPNGASGSPLWLLSNYDGPAFNLLRTI